jgi:hypothetical protein
MSTSAALQPLTASGTPSDRVERLVYLEQEVHLPVEPTLRLAVIVTVVLSIFAHRLSAVPGIDLYAKRIAGLGDDPPEHQEVGA